MKKLPFSDVLNWVSIKDSLPEFTENTPYGKITKPIICLHKSGHVESCMLNEFEGESHYWSYEQDGDYCETVTHWAKNK